jgi:hypothetical protein
MFRSKVVLGMLLTFGAALLLAVITLGVAGVDVQGTNTALAVTGRFSFLLFWPAYTGSAAVAVFGSRFLPLQRRSRDFGLAFASAHLVHLALVSWLCYIGNIPGRGTFLFFGLAVIFTYVLLALSVGTLRLAVGSRLWRMLRFIGMNYIALAFSVDFLTRPINGDFGHIVAYLPFSVLAVFGPMLRLIAWTFKRNLATVREPDLATGGSLPTA